MRGSYAQRDFWLAQAMAPTSSALNLYALVRYEGPADLVCGQRALSELWRQHAALRMRLRRQGPDVLRELGPCVAPPFDCVDAEAWSTDKLYAEAYAFAAQPFPLDAERLARVRFYVHGGQLAGVMAAHHAALDFTSLCLAQSELAERVAALRRGESQPERPTDDAAFIAWEQATLQGPRVQRQLDRWRELVGQSTLRPELVPDRVATPGATRSALLQFTLSATEHDRLDRLARQHGGSLFTLIHAATGLWLARLCGQDDIVFATTLSQRRNAALRSLIGPLTNTVPLRVAVDHGASWEALHREVARALRETMQQATLPYGWVAEQLGAHARLQEVTPLLLNVGAASFVGKPGAPVCWGQCGAVNELVLGAYALDGGLNLQLAYDSALFSEGSVRVWGESLVDLLRRVPDAAQTPVGHLLQGTAPAVVVEETGGPSLQAVWSLAARRFPEHVAVADSEGSLSYTALDARSEAVGQALVARGVAAGDAVGILVPPGVAHAVAVLGVLKARAGFVPLDPSDSAERWRNLMLAARAQCVVTSLRSPWAAEFVAVEIDGSGVCWNTSNAPAPHGDTLTLCPHARASDLAYVMFTSGSTGLAKPVWVEHGAVLNHHHGKIHLLGLNAADTFLQFAPCSFVSYVWQLLAPLQVGARVVFASAEARRDPRRLLQEIAHSGVTVMQVPPAFVAALLHCDGAGVLGRLRCLVTVGEALPVAVARQWQGRFPGVPIVNSYGLTECADDFCHAVLADIDANAARVPIGRPVPNVGVSVLDPRGLPLPVGMPGEICVTGAMLGRGLSQPFHTGDRGRWSASGDLEFLGRIDGQVKLRGRRVAFEDIESAMLECPGVAGAAVRLWGERLVGYIVPRDEALREEVRRCVRSQLPPAACPDIILALDALAIGRTGKVQKELLPPPPLFTGEPPATDLERRLHEQWCGLLGLEKISVDDDFVAVGGHSLKLMELQLAIEDTFGVVVAVGELVAQRTIRAQAAHVQQVISARAMLPRSPPPLPPAPSHPGGAREGPERSTRATRPARVPLSAAQQRFWVVERLHPESGSLNSGGALRVLGRLDRAALAASLADLVAQHEALRTRFIEVEGRPEQEVVANVRLDVEHIAMPGATSSALAERGDACLRFGLRIAEAPLVRVACIARANEEHLLVFAAHHLVCDAWSIDVLLRDFIACYAARVSGRVPELVAPAVQLADVAWREHAADYSVELSRLRRQLEHAQALTLPCAHAVSGLPGARMARLQAEVGAATWRAIEAAVNVRGVTAFSLVCTALVAVLARTSGQGAICLGVTMAARDAAAVANTVGLLLNSLFLRVEGSDNPTLAELASRVQSGLLEALETRHVPCELVIRELGAAAQGFLQTTLTHYQRERRQFASADLRFELADIPPPAAPADLAFYSDASPAGLRLRIDYDRDKYDEPQVHALLRHWQEALRVIATDNQRRLADLALQRPPSRCVDISTAPGRLTTWQDHELGGNIIARFNTVCAQLGDAVAVRTLSTAITYAELQERAQRLAGALLSCSPSPRGDTMSLCPPGQGAGGAGVGSAGPGPARESTELKSDQDERVALLFHNDAPDLATAIVASLYAGRAFVPLDSTHPDARLREILQAASPVALIHGDDQANRAAHLFPEGLRLGVGAAAGGPGALPHVPTDALAYIMFTSGSTGTPKGVTQLHGNVLHFTQAYGAVLGGVGPDDRVCLLSNAAHDAGLMDIFVALLHGATLVPLDVRKHGLAATLDTIARLGVTVVHTTPTFFRAWMAHLGSAPAPRSIRAVVFDGEPSLRSDAEAFTQRFEKGCRLVNCYGSTESSISMQHTVTDVAPLGTRSAFALAAPVDRTAVFLQTPVGEQVAPYGLGEIVVVSRHVASGYWCDAPLSQRTFRRLDDGRIQYFTGDLGRWLPDGSLEVVGRKDRQIKVLGQRVEIDEIESRLRAATGGSDVCVIARPVGQGRSRIEAFVAGAPRDRAGLLAVMRAQLPDFMVPQRCVFLNDLPRTPNGKIDQRVLQRMHSDDVVEPFAAHDALESKLQTLWHELLGDVVLGPETTFFEAGGDSLKLLELHHRLEVLGFRLEPSELFRFPTLRALADRLRQGDADTDLADSQRRAALRRQVLARRGRHG